MFEGQRSREDFSLGDGIETKGVCKAIWSRLRAGSLKDDIVARVRETCDGQGANVAFDAAGVQAGLDQAIQAIRARGTLVNIAIWEKTATITPNWLCFREKVYGRCDLSGRRFPGRFGCHLIWYAVTLETTMMQADMFRTRAAKTGIDDNEEDTDE